MKKQIIISTVISFLSPFIAHYLDMITKWVFYYIDSAIFNSNTPMGSGWMFPVSTQDWVIAINFCLLFLLILRFYHNEQKNRE